MTGSLALELMHQPPDAWAMNDFWQPFMTFVNVIPIVAVVWFALRRWLPGEHRLILACLIGGGVASLVEPMVDHIALVWFAQENQWTMLKVFGRNTPWFILPCYVWYIGGQVMLMLWLLRRGLTMKQLYLVYGAFVLTNVAMEIPAIAADVYRYYGPQPFKIAGLPIWFQSMNAASPIIGAALLHRLGAKRGWHPALAAVVVPSAHVLSNAVAGWPMWTALNSTDSLAITYPVALVTIALASLVVYLVGLTVTEEATAVTPATDGADRREEARRQPTTAGVA
jgi:hypothetical protein